MRLSRYECLDSKPEVAPRCLLKLDGCFACQPKCTKVRETETKWSSVMTPPSIWNEINVSRLAKSLDVSRMAIYKWKASEKGIPAERAIEIEQITGITRERLRPDLWSKAANE